MLYLPPGELEAEIELQLNVGRGIFTIETAVHNLAHKTDLVRGLSNHLQVDASTNFNGVGQMNPVMYIRKHAGVADPPLGPHWALALAKES